MILHVHMCDFSFVWCFPFQGRVGGNSTLFKRAALPTLLSLRSPTHAAGGVYQRVFRKHATGKLDPTQIASSATFLWQKHDLFATGWNCNLSCLYPDCAFEVNPRQKERQHSTATFSFQWCPLFVCFDLLLWFIRMSLCSLMITIWKHTFDGARILEIFVVIYYSSWCFIVSLNK